MDSPSDNSAQPDRDAEKRPRLVCPQCNALYQPTRPTFGRRVRCRHCGHVWRDETCLPGQIAAALGQAAADFGQVGSTLIASADHGSTMGRVVAKLHKVKLPAPGEWIGRPFGKYQMQAVLGQGAMGYVYEALDVDLNRTVAIKLLPRQYKPGSEPVGVRMFIQEARIAAQLAHPGIVTIHEIGNQDGYYFFAMERVRGATLAALIEQNGPLPAKQACYVLAHAALALAAAHKAGVIHRDVKPSNIMVDESGRVKVTDFGLADVAGLEGVDEVRDRILGTPGWIAPEVARGEVATPASDIYSLGLVLFSTLTGKRLIHAKTKSGMVRIHQGAPRISRDQLPPSWPPRLRDICLQCLQVAPKDRYQSAEMLAADLLSALAPDQRDGTLALDESPERPPRKALTMTPRTMWLSLGALGVIVVALALWLWLRK